MTDIWTKKFLLKDLKRVKTLLNVDTFSYNEYKKHGKYSTKPFRTHFGSWTNALAAINCIALKAKRIAPSAIVLRDFSKVDNLQLKDALIGADLHMPYHNTDMLNVLIETGRKLRIKNLVLVGDTFDFKTLYTKTVNSKALSWIAEQKIAKDILIQMSKHFIIDIVPGNHELRLSKLLQSIEDAEDFYKLLYANPKIVFHDVHQHIAINDWLHVSHYGNTKIKLAKAERIANVHRKSLLVFHSHRFAFCVADSGIEVIGEGLHLTRPELHEYAQVHLSDFSQWVEGFWILKDDKIYPYVNHEHIGKPLGLH